jgi:hypothetical protein
MRIAAPWNRSFAAVLIRCLPGRTSTMRWKISHRGHDPRQIDLLAAMALIVLIIVGYRYFSEPPATHGTASFIVPSQNVRW